MVNQCAKVLLATTIALSAGNPKAKDIQIKTDNAANISQAVRSDTKAFWTYAQQASVQRQLAPYLSFMGMIQGDPHPGNFAPTLVETTGGRRDIRMVVNDFDNVGIGPFALEFSHMVVQLKAIDPDLGLKEILKAYLDGVDGKVYDPPKSIRETLDMTVAGYDALRAAYVEKKVDGDRLKRKAGRVQDYKGIYKISDMQALFPDRKILDIAERIQERGGNTGLRLWILTEDARGVQIIEELKDYQPTAIGAFFKQPPLKEWSKLAHEIMWPGLNPKTYDVVTMKDGRIFWLRQKAVSLLDVPYSATKGKKREFAEKLCLFNANHYGLMAGAQSEGRGFAAAVRNDQGAFRDAVKLIIYPYLTAAEQQLGKN